MSNVNLNGTSSCASDSEHADCDIKSNSSVSSVSSFEEDKKSNSNESSGKSSALMETICGLPIVTDSIENAKKYRFFRFTWHLADAGARKVSYLVSEKISDQIENLDKMAAATIQQFSCQFPIVKEPTDKIFSTLKEPAIQTIITVRQYHEQLSCTIENNITKFDSQLAPLVDLIEVFIQKMIPDEKGETNREIQDDQQIAQTLRVLQIALATRDRCVERVKKQLTTTQSYTAEQLRQLQESNQLLSRATDTVNTLNQALLGMVVNLRDTVQNPDLAVTLQAHLQNIAAVIYKDEENLPKAVQARIVDYSTALLAITDGIGNYIKLIAQHSPEYLQERLRPLVNFFEERYGDIVNEIKNGKGSTLEKAKNILNLTTNHTLPLLRSSLSDLQEAIQCYTNSLNTTFHNQFNTTSASQILNVK
uniref:Cytoskeleton-associated protein 4 n=1 Tax=Anthurium amnicola TaxID=1678845 RepID=A0A1D1YJ33_9ARAE